MLPNIEKKEHEVGDVRSGLKPLSENRAVKPLRLNQQVLAVGAGPQDR